MRQDSIGELHEGSYEPSAEDGAAAILLKGLVKTYGDRTVVDDVTLRIPAGSFYGLVGPNGAGKTTLLSMAVGLIRPDAGTSQILGADVWSDPATAKTSLGVLPQAGFLPQRLTGQEVLTYVGLLRGMSRKVVDQRTAELLRVLGLNSAAHVVVADYSTGMSKKIALATAVLHGPRVLVLDEPFESVDPISAATIKAILQGFVHSGGTVVLSSHVMLLVESLCDRLAIMADGAVAASGTLAEVRAGRSLDDAFTHIIGADTKIERLSWFGS